MVLGLWGCDMETELQLLYTFQKCRGNIYHFQTRINRLTTSLRRYLKADYRYPRPYPLLSVQRGSPEGKYVVFDIETLTQRYYICPHINSAAITTMISKHESADQRPAREGTWKPIAGIPARIHFLAYSGALQGNAWSFSISVELKIRPGDQRLEIKSRKQANISDASSIHTLFVCYWKGSLLQCHPIFIDAIFKYSMSPRAPPNDPNGSRTYQKWAHSLCE